VASAVHHGDVAQQRFAQQSPLFAPELKLAQSRHTQAVQLERAVHHLVLAPNVVDGGHSAVELLHGIAELQIAGLILGGGLRAWLERREKKNKGRTRRKKTVTPCAVRSAAADSDRCAALV
jgi:hypothetical protein